MKLIEISGKDMPKDMKSAVRDAEELPQLIAEELVAELVRRAKQSAPTALRGAIRRGKRGDRWLVQVKDPAAWAYLSESLDNLRLIDVLERIE